MIKFSPKKIFATLKRNSKFMFIFTIAGIIAGILYACIIFKPAYKAQAKLLIKNPAQTAFVNYKNGTADISIEDRNFIFTQMEILKSEQLASKVWKKIKEKHNLNYKDREGIEKVKNAISVNNPGNTNVIKLTASWLKPEIAQAIALSAISAYRDLSIDIESGDRLAVEKKLQQTQQELLKVRNKIKDFKKKNSTIDLEQEAKDLTARIMTLENKQQELDLAAATEAYKINTIARNLDIQDYDIKRTAAAGNIINLSSKLEALQDQLAGLSTKYTELHPDVKNIKSRIERLEGQIQNQLELSLGNKLKNNKLKVSDPVRVGMMEVLISSKEKYKQLQAQNQNLVRTLKELEQKRSEIPQRQFILKDYEQQEASLINIVNNLKSKQAELHIKEAEIPVSARILDSPAIPASVTFPGRLEVIMIVKFFFGLLASMFILTREYLKNSYSDAEEMEKDLNTPVLGVIPWLDIELYDEQDVMYAIEETASFYSLAYQKTVSGMRIKGDFRNNRAISFTSSEFSKNRSTIIMNIAYSLSRTGESVVVMDADFRTPSIGKDMNFDVNSKYSLAQLLALINKDIQETGGFDEEKINLYTRSIPNVNKFFIIPNSGNVADPCEFLYSQAFEYLVKTLKNKYDWVLIDSPPAMAVPDAFMAGRYADGTIIISGLETNKSVLRKIHRQFKDYNISVLGVIARELQEKEAIFSNKYIRQMINRLIPQNEGALV